MVKPKVGSNITAWSYLVAITLLVVFIPRLNIHNRLTILASLSIIFGKTYYVALKVILGCIMLYTRPNIDLFCSISKTIFNDVEGDLSALKKARSKIFICNYPECNLVEYFSQGLIPQNYALVVNKKTKIYTRSVYPKDRVIMLELDDPNSDNYTKLKKEIKNKTDLGYNIFCYFDNKHVGNHEKEKKTWRYGLKGVRTGIFKISIELGIPIIPIVMDHLYINNGYIPPQKFRIKVLKEVSLKGLTDISEIVKNYKKTLKSFHSSKFL